jgi:hypothetical protein
MWSHSIGNTGEFEAGALSASPDFRMIRREQKGESRLSIPLSLPRWKGLLEPISNPEHVTGMATSTASAGQVMTGS